MILIKGFLKHKSSRIYIVVLIVMMLSISIIFEVAQYYSNIITNVYQKNSYFFLISQEDVLDEIQKNKYIENIEKVAAIKKEKINISEFPNINNNFLIDPGNNYIIVSNERNRNIKIGDEEVVFELPKFVLNNSDRIFELKEKEMLIDDSIKLKLKISNICESNFSRVIVSDYNFEKLKSDSKSFTYIFQLNDYTKQQEIVSYFQEKENVKIDFIQFYDGEAEINAVEVSQDTINYLFYAYIAVVCLFYILVIIILHNIIHDEMERMHLERLLGYNKWQIKKIILIKILILNMIVISIYFSIFVLMNWFVNNIFKIQMCIKCWNELFITLVLLLVSAFLCFLEKIKNF